MSPRSHDSNRHGWLSRTWSVNALVIAAAVFWTASANHRFLAAALQGRLSSDASAWGFGVALTLGVCALHVLLLCLVATRWTVKPAIAALTIAAASAGYYMQTYGVYMDPSMLRNVLRTNPAEARELMGFGLWLHLALFAGLPLLLLWRVRLRRDGWRRGLGQRLLLAVLALLTLVGAVLAVFKPLSSLMRNQKELRYLITPANLVWSGLSVATADLKGAAKPRQPIGEDARPGPSWSVRSKPLVVVLVVGETARAANWGLSGYARPTTPQLATLPVVNIAQVASCGTNTEVSLPCMFAPIGRRDYDEDRIRGQQSLLHVLARAGVAVHWRDNQSGCKGVCEGLPSEQVEAARAPAELCPGGRCFDEALIHDLPARLGAARGTQLWVFHQLGSHGPSYFRRYPPAFARFQPACQQDDLQRCSQEEIVNAYDNTLLYTDHLVATAVQRLRDAEATVDSALIYVSDHGESLGEKGLFLHGLPYAIAPDVQKRVPMVLWASRGLEQAAGLQPGCLMPHWRGRSAELLSHDHLFHTVLGLLDVRTGLQEPTLDLTRACRADAGAAR